MSLMKRALLYLVRKKGRSILLLLVIFVMSTFMLMGIAVKFSADQAAEEISGSMGSGFTLEIDDENPANYGPLQHGGGYSYQLYDGPVITQELVDEITAMDGVSGSFTDITEIIWTELELRPGLYSDDYQYYQEYPEHLENHHSTMDGILLFSQNTDLYCSNDGSLHHFFRTGALQMTEGRNIQEGDRFKAVISTELARRNGLSIGSTFAAGSKEGLYQPSDDPFKTLGELMELEIVGLFDTNFEQESSPYTFESGYADNFIFTDMETHRQTRKTLQEAGITGNQEEIDDKITFFVESPRLLDFILTEVRSREDVRGLLLKLDDVAYRASVKPLKQMSGFSSFLIVASMLGVVIVLYLVLHMWTKDRKREIGILLSMGIKKFSIRMQLIWECLIISIIALVLSFFVAGLAINSFGTFSEALAASELHQEELYTVTFDKMLKPVVEKVSSEPVQLSYELSFSAACLITALTLGLAAGSVFLASLQTLRMKPKDILSSV